MNIRQITKIFSFLTFCLYTFLVSYSQANAHGPDKNASKSLHTNKFSFGSVGISKQVTRIINITMDDNSYQPEVINVKSGEVIHFKIKNNGDAVHEFNIGKKTMHIAHQEEMQQMMDRGILEFDKVNHHMMTAKGGMSHDDPNSILLEPDKSGELIWKFKKTQHLEYACNIPGHYESGMHGTINFTK
jgi:uncharacterized cupredoxin-like copper-binding protein